MTTPFSQNYELSLLLLEQVENSSSSGEFWEKALPVVRQILKVESLVVLQSVPPEWRRKGQAGEVPKEIPAELAAEALDRLAPARSGSWIALPLDQKKVLLLNGSIDDDKCKGLQGTLTLIHQLVEQRQQRTRRILRLEKLLEITHAWGQSECMQSLLEAMANAATELLDADRASIFLWDKANKMLVGRPALGIKADGELRIPDDRGIVGHVVQTREPRRVGGGMDDSQIDRKIDQETGYTTRTLICVPLIGPQGQCMGAFEVLNKNEGLFTDEDEQGLIELAAHAAVTLENTQQWEELLSKHQLLVEEAAEGLQLIGESAAIGAVRSTIRRIADTDLAILVLGENGTGKEIVARSIHYLSRRRDQPFIAVNCAALTESLLESELFGHEKGAFTDAHETRAGKFELATGGTLFLDEIGDMSLSGQAKLLRVLEDKTIVRVGGSQTIHTEVRILAATNQNLAKMVREKRFREDLFFRLNVVSLELPPLRERGDDVLLLSDHFLETFCRNMGRSKPQFSPSAKNKLLEHPWPGNIRELRNLMERLAYLTTGDRIEADDLAFINAGAGGDALHFDFNASLADATRDFQQKYIKQTIDNAGGNMSKAAKRLNLHRSNLYRKLKQLEMGIGEEDDEGEGS
ncbi:sigma-54-dependent Fis family transcriptional regulator [Bythopirellula goksoeyrii]|uniref:Transcriptional regulatory protein ZraR n=1 Tax=Bythopirellula goksoeyrii TaxID=1400387 RepID=A0A5B9QF71_9BACT|nr:sigma-54-dependent Fis family transcriptional regulator [Bythopirellula goksoeyrii]QEG32963.1 Transcriptional regulatory protein ZraR [Bythopirellula goksoeyrii]